MKKRIAAHLKPQDQSLEVPFLGTFPTYHKSFQALADNVPDVICRFDRKNTHLYVNPAITKITGFPQDSFIGRTPHDIMPKPFADFWAMHLKTVFTFKKPITIEFTYPSEEGVKHFQSFLVPEIDEFGEVETVLSISRDITNIKEEERRKDEFFGVVSHELRTPVTSIKAFVQVLHNKLKKAGDSENAEHLLRVDAQLTKLSHLISDLLDVTRLVGGKLQFREERFDFNTLIKEVVADIRPITNHRIMVRGKVKKKIFADRERIGQVITNLLTNAIKYSPKGKRIHISMSSRTSEIICCVRDYGVGIPKEQVEKIFERFYQLRKEDGGKLRGLGLGLYISSEIIKNHNGKIWVESEVGKGSVFCFSLPYRKVLKKTSKKN